MVQSCLLNTSLAVGNHLPIGIQKLLIFVRYRLSFNEWVLLIHPGLCERIVQQFCYYLSQAIWVYSSDIQPKHCLSNNRVINHLRNNATGDVVLANVAQIHACQMQNLGADTVNCRNCCAIKFDQSPLQSSNHFVYIIRKCG